MGTYFGSALFHLWLRFVKILNFTNSWRWISLFGLGACFGMGGCLCSLVPIWVLLGLVISLRVLVDLLLPECFGLLTLQLLHVAWEPGGWTDGSMVDAEDCCCRVILWSWIFYWPFWSLYGLSGTWGHIDDGLPGGIGLLSLPVVGIVLCPGPLQSVQRAELWGVILALQASCGVHLGVWII